MSVKTESRAVISIAMDHAERAVKMAKERGHDHILLRGHMFAGGDTSPPGEPYKSVEQALKQMGCEVSFEGSGFTGEIGVVVSW